MSDWFLYYELFPNTDSKLNNQFKFLEWVLEIDGFCDWQFDVHLLVQQSCSFLLYTRRGLQDLAMNAQKLTVRKFAT